MRYIHMLNKSIFAIFGLRKKDKIKVDLKLRQWVMNDDYSGLSVNKKNMQGTLLLLIYNVSVQDCVLPASVEGLMKVINLYAPVTTICPILKMKVLKTS